MNPESTSLLRTPEERGRAVAWALRFAENTSLDPDTYERSLLARFVEGSLSLDQVVEQLEQAEKTA